MPHLALCGAVPISIHAPHEGERLLRCGILPSSPRISIHAPHEGERRACQCYRAPCSLHFNPRSPRGGATRRSERRRRPQSAFQSTLPTRGSDPDGWPDSLFIVIFQSTLPTRGSDPCVAVILFGAYRISIHAPHEGERRNKQIIFIKHTRFQSTLPTRGSDGRSNFRGSRFWTISIHAPHEGERPVNAGVYPVSV